MMILTCTLQGRKGLISVLRNCVMTARLWRDAQFLLARFVTSKPTSKNVDKELELVKIRKSVS